MHDRGGEIIKKIITDTATREVRPATDSLHCPYCESARFTRRGFRQKKHERVQLYLCSACRRTFTARLTKGKRYPLAAILDGISIYNLGYSLVQSCRALKERFALDIRHRRFHPLKEFLELVSSECPHQYFQEGLRASESPLAFSKKEMIVRGQNRR